MSRDDNGSSVRTTDFSKKLTTHYVRISLIVTSGGRERVPDRSGLNWGQRAGRNPNQAYLPIPAADQRSGFFPEVGEAFSVECDDGFKLTLVRAQQNGKALETPDNNALLGEYFRRANTFVVVSMFVSETQLPFDIYMNTAAPVSISFEVRPRVIFSIFVHNSIIQEAI